MNPKIMGATVGTPHKPSAVSEKIGPFLVTVAQSEDGDYTVDKTYGELVEAKRAGRTLSCRYYDDDVYLPFTAYHGLFTFSAVIDSKLYQIDITAAGQSQEAQAIVTTTPIGISGKDGITPHIGANGNWWIGEEDTGVSAGVTDEQISGAVEEYMEENPLVKTVNGTAPDENGNVKLDIPSGGGGGGGYSRNKLVYSLTLTEQVSSIAISFTPEQQAILENANGYAIALDLLSGEGVVAEDKNPGNVDIRPGYRHDAIQLAGAVPTDKTNVTEIPSVGYVDRRLAQILPNGGSVLVRTVVRAKVSPTYTHPNTRCTTDFKNEFTITLDYPVGIGSSVNVYAIDVAGV